MSEPRARADFSPRTMIALVLVGVFSFAGFTVLSVYAPDLRGGNDGEAHALSKSAVGFAGAVTLLQAEGAPVVVSRTPLHSLVDSGGLRVISPGVMPDRDEMAAYRGDGPLLIILPKWNVTPDETHLGWVKKLGVITPDAAAAPIRAQDHAIRVAQRPAVSRPALRGAGGPFGPEVFLPLDRVDHLQTLAGEGWRPILTDEQGGVVLASWGRSQMYVLSDPDLLNTQGLKGLNTARAGMAILDGLRGDRGVAFDVTLNGFKRARDPLRLLFEPPLVGGFLCVLVAAALMGVHAAVRFGPVVREGRAFALGKRALIDNSAALIRAAHKEPELVAAYVSLVEARTARLLGERETDPAARAERLVRLERQRRPAESLETLKTAAGAAKTRGDALALALRLFKWRSDMSHDRR